MHDLSKLAPDDLPGARAACETLIFYREALDPRFYDKVCGFHAAVAAREQRYELEDTAKVTRIRKHINAQIAASGLDSATVRVFPECLREHARCAELLGQIKDHLHTLEITMNEAARRVERRIEEWHDEMISRIDHLTDLVTSRKGA